MTQRICSVEGCGRERRGRGYCHRHWMALTGPERPCEHCGEIYTNRREQQRFCSRKCQHAGMRSDAICEIPNCGRKLVARNYCDKHYRRYGGTWTRVCHLCEGEFHSRKRQKYCSVDCRVSASRAPLSQAISDGNQSEIARLVRERVEPAPGGCLEWPQRNNQGYPVYQASGIGVFLMHRLAFELSNGPLAEGAQVHHICANRACINVEHLQETSTWENVGEMMQRRFYVKRIAALEAALRRVDPGHKLLT